MQSLSNGRIDRCVPLKPGPPALSAADSSTCFHGFSVVLSLAGGLHETARWRCGSYLGRTIDYGRVVNPSRQVRTFCDLFLITELLDFKAESDDIGFGAELAWMSCQIERAFRFVEVLKKAAPIHQTEARLIRRYSGYLGRGRTHAAKAH